MIRWLGYYWLSRDPGLGYLSPSSVRYWILKMGRER